MNEIYIVDGVKYNVGPNRKEEFLKKFPNAQLDQPAPGKKQPTTQKGAESVGVSGQPEIRVPFGALNLDSNLVNTLLESPNNEVETKFLNAVESSHKPELDSYLSNLLKKYDAGFLQEGKINPGLNAINSATYKDRIEKVNKEYNNYYNNIAQKEYKALANSKIKETESFDPTTGLSFFQNMTLGAAKTFESVFDVTKDEDSFLGFNIQKGALLNAKDAYSAGKRMDKYSSAERNIEQRKERIENQAQEEGWSPERLQQILNNYTDPTNSSGKKIANTEKEYRDFLKIQNAEATLEFASKLLKSVEQLSDLQKGYGVNEMLDKDGNINLTFGKTGRAVGEMLTQALFSFASAPIAPGRATYLQEIGPMLTEALDAAALKQYGKEAFEKMDDASKKESYINLIEEGKIDFKKLETSAVFSGLLDTAGVVFQGTKIAKLGKPLIRNFYNRKLKESLKIALSRGLDILKGTAGETITELAQEGLNVMGVADAAGVKQDWASRRFKEVGIQTLITTPFLISGGRGIKSTSTQLKRAIQGAYDPNSLRAQIKERIKSVNKLRETNEITVEQAAVEIDNLYATEDVISNSIFNKFETESKEEMIDLLSKEKGIKRKIDKLKNSYNADSVFSAGELKALQEQLNEIEDKKGDVIGLQNYLVSAKILGKHINDNPDKYNNFKVHSFDTNEELNDFAKRNGISEEQVKGIIDNESFGAIVDDQKVVLLSKENVKNAKGKTPIDRIANKIVGGNVVHHELGHIIMSTLSDKDINDFVKNIRIEAEKLPEGSKLKQAFKEARERVKKSYSNSSNRVKSEEILTSMSDFLRLLDADILVDDASFLSKIFSNLAEKLNLATPDNIDFSGLAEPGQALQFFKKYNSFLGNSKTFFKGATRIAEVGAEKPKITPPEESKESKPLGADIQKIYDEKGVEGAVEIIEAYKPLTTKITNKYRDVPGFDFELLQSEIEIGQRGLLDLIQSYTPDRGATLNTYVQGQLERRAIEAANRILDTEFTLDVTEAKGVTDTTTEEVTERVTEKPEEKIDNKLMSKLNINENIKNKVVDAIVKTLGTKLPSLKSGKLKAELTKSFRTELKPVIAKMIGTRAAYDTFMADNFKLIYNALPQSTINRRFNEFAEPVLDKDGKQLREKTAVGKGIFKKKDIVKAEWLKYFIDQPGNVKGTRKTAIAEEIGVELAFDATTEVLKNPKVLERFKATQEVLGNVVADNVAEDIAKQINRGNVKYSQNLLDLPLDLQKQISDGLQTKEFKSLLANRAGNPTAIKEAFKLYFNGRIEDLDNKKIAAIASDLNKANVVLDFKTVANEKSAIKAAELLSKQLVEEIELPTEYVSVEISENKVLEEDVFSFNTINEARIATKYLVDNLGDDANPILDGTQVAGRLAGIFDVAKTPDGIIIEESNFKKSGSKTKRYSIFRNIADASQALGRKPVAIQKDLRTKNFVTNPKSKFNKLNEEEKIEYMEYLAKEGVKLKKLYLIVLKELRKGYKEGAITQGGGKMFLLTQFGNMQGLGKAMAAPRKILMKPNGKMMSFKEMIEYGLGYKNDVGVLEHMIPAKKMATLSYKYFLSGDVKVLKEIENLLEDYNTMIIPKKMDDFIKARGLQEIIGIAKDRYAGTGVIIMDVLTGEMVNTGVIPEKSNVKYSKNLNTEFNQLLQATTGVEYYKEFSPAKARLVGRGKGKRKFFIPYSADDFVGLLYATLGEGKVGDKQMAWYEENLLRPFSRGIQQYEAAKQKAMREWMALSSQIKKDVPGGLNKRNETGFRNQDSLRMYIWAKQGMEIPGAAKKDVNEAVSLVNNNPKLKEFAEKLIALNPDGYPAPGQSWDAGDITTDIVSYVNDVRRGEFLTEWKENVDQIFTDKNKQKLLALYGQNYIDALEDMLHRMKTGRNRKFGITKAERTFMDWTNNSVGAIMFFNARSAVLQTLSAVNFINFSDNNPINAGLAFANQPQYWKDFATLFNSDFLKQRRTGLQTDVNADEIANAAKSSTNKAKAALSAILKLGFTPTQIADSFAIASGGATFYRNRIKKYIKEGLDKEAAEKKAFTDFQEIAEETQQSARPDRISMQQASSLGRFILAFGNTPMQYARLTKKAALDLINGRGDWKTNISKIAYYSVIQNIIFSALQQGLFALLFDEEDEEKEKSRYFRIGNSSIDTLLRGSGVYGAAAATVKNMILEIIEQSEKSRPDYTKVAIEATTLSPPINSKLRKLESAGKTFTYKQSKEKVFTEGFSFENPAFLAGGRVISAVANIPVDRVVQKADHIHTAMQDETELWQAIALSLGWSEWDLNMIEKQTKKSPSKVKTKLKTKTKTKTKFKK